MNLRFYRQLRRLPLHGLLILASAAFPMAASAVDLDCESEMVPVIGTSTPCEFELAGTEELCGWGTHDSYEPSTPAKPAASSSPVATFESSFTIIATAACASAGVSVEQIVEPFAMVGPYLDQSVETVRKFQSWWGTAVGEAASRQAASTVVTVDLQDEIDAIAAQEPIDVESLGKSVLVVPTHQLDVLQPGIRVTAIDKLVGGSAIIATIEDDYLPYDLSARDMKLWSVFPTSTHPFCIRSRGDDLDVSPLWQDFEAAVHSQSDVSEEDASYVFSGSAECLLDELIWKVESLVAEDSPLWAALEPHRIGHQLQVLASGGKRIAARAVRLLASNWPEVETGHQPSAAGGALLARAGAIEASEPFDASAAAADQIAEAPTGTIVR